VVGGAPEAKLMVIGVASATSFYNQALPWADARGARVMVFPYIAEDLLGQTCAQYGGAPLNRSQKLANSNILVFWGCTDEFPGCDPAAASVGGTTEDDLPYIEIGPPNCAVASQYVDFAAPAGRGWLTGVPPYGISYALGNAAGAAALVLSENPALTRAQLLTRLQQTADKVGPYAYTGGRNDYYGHGRLNVYRGALVGDVDGDGVPGDGDGSWVVGDDPCAGGTSGCDDNCPVEPNASQTDNGRVGVGGADGIGNACQCGDVTGDGKVLTDDADQIQAFLTGGALTVPGKCNVVGEQGGSPSLCQLDDWVIVRRGALGLPTSVGQVCDPALP
jgi:subtilisin family serine protease